MVENLRELGGNSLECRGGNSVEARKAEKVKAPLLFLWLKNVSRFYFMRHLIKRANFFLSFNGGCREHASNIPTHTHTLKKHIAMHTYME